MALIFLEVFITFTVSSFNKSDCLDFIAMMSGHNSPNLSPLEYQVWSNAGVLTKAATEAKTSSRVVKCTLVNSVCVTGESYWQRCERL